MKTGAVLALPVLLAAALLLQLASGTFGEGFGSFDDEPSHLVTGLLFRDYLAQGCPDAPLAYARDYYLHYPKVGIGQWPPLFYAAQALWTLVGGDSASSLHAFAAALAALTATALFALLRPRVGALGAGFAALAFLVLPLVQTFSGTLMTEMQLALCCTLAVGAFARFLASGARSALALFALAAVAGILTKGNAMALSLLPPFAIGLHGSWRLVRRPALWIAGLAVALLCAPWYLLTVGISASTWDGGAQPSLEYATYAAPLYLRMFLELGGPALALGAALGALLRPREAEARALWAALSAWPLAWFLFHLALPSSVEARHWILATPALVALAALGARELGARCAPQGSAWRAAPAALLLLGLLPALRVEPKPNRGYGAAVDQILADPALRGAVLLVASDAIGEGLVVGELALGDADRPSHYALRASKVLASMDWSGGDYAPRFATAADLLNFLRRVPVGVVLFDHSVIGRRRQSYYDQLLALLREEGGAFELLTRRDLVRDGTSRPGALEIYRLRGSALAPEAPLDPAFVLGAEAETLRVASGGG